MDNVILLPGGSPGSNFITPEFIPKGKDEYYLRYTQNTRDPGSWRHLNPEEIKALVENGNSAEDWNSLLVSEPFDPARIRHSSFHGMVRIGTIRDAVVKHHDLILPTGIYYSTIIDSDIGDDCSLHHVHYLSHYIIGDRCILSDIGEMHTTDHAKFGNGILKEGEPENVRVWLDIMNETGSRKVLPFDGMITADAYLWAKYRDDKALQRRLFEITQASFDSRRGYYGTVGDQSVIKTSRIVKDVKIGPHTYIKGANKLKNLTINSSEEEPSQIGEGVELVNGIIGYGCHIFYGCKAVRFILGNNSNLKYGARLINSFLGDNSTISCCEVLNNLLFPAHEQHHNNSFLIASVVMGQSNMAAGATVGSNHNSRANDNEVQAGRGFWPGLVSSIKHSSRFASFILLAKGAYPAELDIPLPFSLLNNNETAGRLEVIPAFWWLYNMYALIRNSWKFHNRDRRVQKPQHIEFDYLAPDTAEEILHARELLELWTGKALLQREGKSPESMDEDDCRRHGREWLNMDRHEEPAIDVLGENMEKSRRKVLIMKPVQAYRAYGDMLLYYSVKTLAERLLAEPGETFSLMQKNLDGPRCTDWVNLGGQIVRASDLDALRSDIGSGVLQDWDAIHERYDQLWDLYPLEKQRHAFSVFRLLTGGSKEAFLSALERTIKIQEFIREQVYASRNKDFENPYRLNTYRNHEEMTAAIGTIDDNSFIRLIGEETEAFITKMEDLQRRLKS
jgi:NDP-sugar pyrophosphorylase family protein